MGYTWNGYKLLRKVRGLRKLPFEFSKSNKAHFCDKASQFYSTEVRGQTECTDAACLAPVPEGSIIGNTVCLHV